MEWRLRTAGPADAAALSLVASAAFLDAFAGQHAGSDIVAHCANHYAPGEFARYAATPGCTLTIAEAAPRAAPLGYSMLSAPDLPVETLAGDIELRRIYALAITWRSGLGKALMARAIDDARGAGGRRLLLGCNVNNARALAFYARQGFTVIGARQFLMGTSLENDHVLAREV